MKKNNIIIKIQNITGATASELAVALLILLGLFGGLALKNYYEPEFDNNEETISYFDILDSLAEIQATTYTGSDTEGNEIDELAKNDTLIPKKSVFTGYKKKQLPEEKINLNTASKLELMELPGVGEKTALKIIQYRKNNLFENIEEIENVSGIGPKKFEKMKKYLQV